MIRLVECRNLNENNRFRNANFTLKYRVFDGRDVFDPTLI